MSDDAAFAPFLIARCEDGTPIELGRGAMGITYQAIDPQLGRTVALKVINASHLGRPAARERFLREARAAAQLQHPNVAGIFQMRADDEAVFYAMEFIAGETLEAHVARRGPLPWRLALRVILQAAQGLATAHERGLIHRDIKPANLMLAREPVGDGTEDEDGLLVKVIDFGLAKILEGGGQTGGLTGGNAVGTPYYMSPEQISPEAGTAPDCRSDIYSLGATLWHLLTGRVLFEGSQFQVFSQHLQRSPPLVELIVAGVPPTVVSLAGSMLAKDREKRPTDHRALIAALKEALRTTRSASAPQPPGSGASTQSGDRTIDLPVAEVLARTDDAFRIAVLPFTAVGEGEAVAFANGLREDMMTGLSRFRYLSVEAKAATEPKEEEAGDASLAAARGARHVLGGSIRQAGKAVRVSTHLANVRTGAQLWAETYDHDLREAGMFSVQDDVASRIVATVADPRGVLVRIMADELRLKPDAALPPVAWQFAYSEQITPAQYAAFKVRVEAALARNERHSDLWACLCQVHADMFAFGFGDESGRLDRALAAGRRAVELDRASQFALVALARVHFFRRDLAAFRPTAERAMALNPLNTDALGVLAVMISLAGEFRRGADLARRAMALNPSHAGWMHFAPVWSHFHRRDYERALARANRVDIPGFFWTYVAVAAACGHLGRRAEAAAAVRDLLALDPEFMAHARSRIERWHFASDLARPILEGLHKAGLDLSREPEVTPSPAFEAASSSRPKLPGPMRPTWWQAMLLVGTLLLLLALARAFW